MASGTSIAPLATKPASSARISGVEAFMLPSGVVDGGDVVEVGVEGDDFAPTDPQDVGAGVGVGAAVEQGRGVGPFDADGGVPGPSVHGDGLDGDSSPGRTR
ncbi:MAG: hypothetical protein ACRDRG_00280 [Pseudonocardiaceae bacterium]